MKKLIVSCLIGAMCLSSLVPVNASGRHKRAIIGTDDRQRVSNIRAYPYNAVVRVDMTGYFGSGILIAPNKVLTCAHCSTTTEKNRSKPNFPLHNLYVDINFQNGVPRKKIEVKSIHYINTFRTTLTPKNGKDEENIDNENINKDVAILTLNENVTDVGNLPSIAYYIPKVGDGINVVGYPYDKNGFMYSGKGKIRKVKYEGFTNIIEYDADMLGGNSGGPVFDKNNNIIGINSAEDKRDKKNFGVLLSGKIQQLITMALNDSSSKGDVNKVVYVYRLYNDYSNEHIFTVDINERDSLVRNNNWKYEKVAWISNTKGNVVYRMFNPSLQKHVYTKSINEKSTLEKQGWIKEGIAWYDDGDTKIYRLYNPTLKTHMFTSDNGEKEVLQRNGWKYEGIGFSAISKGEK